MGTSTRAAGAAEPRPAIAAQGVSTEALPSTAWLLALPCAVLACALVVLLGPPLSRVLYPAQLPFTLLPNTGAKPEPVEGTRYLLSLSAPVLLAGAIVLAARRPPRLSARATRVLSTLAQLLAAGVVAWCLVKQREADWRFDFFAPWQLLLALPLAAGIVWLAQRGWPRLRPREGRTLRLALPALLALATGVWFLSFVQTDHSIWRLADPYNTGFQFDETFAVLNGHTPLVDFTAAYGSVWALASAPLMLLLGKTLLAYTLVLWALVIVTMLAVYGVFRRVTHSSLAALGLALPLMAFAFFAASRDIHRPIAIYQEMPLRNVGPFLIAWLVARQLDRGGRDAAWPLFLASGLATLNNVEFGIASLGATVAALAWTASPLDRRFLARLAAQAALGLALAYVGYAALTLLRAGALPNPFSALAVARIYAVGGVALNPLPHVIGLPLVVYLTYAAAFGVATVRALRGAPNRRLTGMLAWSAIFGYGSGVYYMGESVPQGVPTTFFPWGFALALLTVTALEGLELRPRRLPSAAALAAVLGFALIATFAFEPPARFAPWSHVAALRSDRLSPRLTQIREIGTPLAAPRDPQFIEFVGSTPEPGGRSVLRRGTAIALFWSTGHAVADAYGLVNVVPFAGESVFTTEQLDDALARLRAARGAVVLLPELIEPRVAAALAARGFKVLTTSGYREGVPGETIGREQIVSMHGLTKWADARALPASS